MTVFSHPRLCAQLAAGVLSFGIGIAHAQPPQSTPPTHRYHLADPALVRAAQRYDWAQEGKGDRAALEELVADDYVLFRGNGQVTGKAGLIGLICHPGAYTYPYTVETPFVRDLGSTVILGGWVRLSGTDQGKPFVQKARFADIWHNGAKGWQLTFTQVTPADHP